ncbi:MAG: DUF5060 domain-containing protein [Pirellulales bacterium]|nr:DUF5060 domain-containing protein [Pirellulales bacterium]
MNRLVLCAMLLPLIYPDSSVAASMLRLGAFSSHVEKYGLIEWMIVPLRQYDNPFDPQQVNLSLIIQTPQGRTLKLPAFFLQEYERKTITKSGRQTVWIYPIGEPVWKARFTPSEVGHYRVIAELRDAEGVARSEAIEFSCVVSSRLGFVRVSRQDPRFFEFDEGQPFFPIGQNLAFIGESQYVTLPKMAHVCEQLAENGANWLRVWTCCHDWALAIEARKSAWGRSWNWFPPITPLPGKESSGQKCLRLTENKGAELPISPSHPVALRPDTNYVLSGRIKTESQAQVQVTSGRHRLETPIKSDAHGNWLDFHLEFTTGSDEYWLGQTALHLEGRGIAWIDAISLKEAVGSTELLWEADVNREERGFYNPVDCSMLDQVVALAQQHGIYLQLCLITRDLYMGSLKDDQSAEYQRAINDAKNLLRYVIARWGYSTAIVSWEYFNEQDPGLPTNRFYRELGEYLQEIDIYHHLRSTSTWHPSPRDWRHPHLDVADTHFYLRPGSERKYADEVEAILGNAAELRQHASDKPALIGEFGLANPEWQPTKEMKESSEVIDFHNGLWASALSGTSGTAMFWWWDRLDQRNHYRHYRPLADFVAGIPWTAAGLQTARVRVLHPRIHVHGLAGREQAYLWLFDPQASFESVVIRGVNPQLLPEIQLELMGLSDGNYRVQWWDTQTGKVVKQDRTTVTDQLLRLTVPSFARDLAAKILQAVN